MGYYVIYLRKSRADVEKERLGRFETLAVHEKRLTELARAQGLPVAEIYRELVSGESISERHEFQRVMDRISDPDCDGVIVHAVDRLGRGDPMEYGWILSAFRWSGTSIVTPNRTYDPANPDDLQQLKLQMFVSNIEFEHIRARLHEGSIRAVENGSYIGSKPPYGYDRAVIDRKHTLTPNDEAPVVRTMFRMASEGSNKGAIARHLNGCGIKTRHGKLWTSTRVGAMLSNPVYKGLVRFGMRQDRIVARDGMRFVRKCVVNAPGTYTLARGIHEPLVDEETWEQANRKAFEGVPVKRDRAIKNPLAGLIVCGNCGRALIRQDVKNKYGEHYPRLRHAYHTECQCKSISLAYVVDCLCEALERIASDLETGAIPCGVDRSELDGISAELDRESRRLDKLMELFYADAITVHEFKVRRDAADEHVRKLQTRHDELVARDIDASEVAFRTREAISTLRDDGVSAEDKNTVLKAIVERIEYFEHDRARVNRDIELRVKLRGL